MGISRLASVVALPLVVSAASCSRAPAPDGSRQPTPAGSETAATGAGNEDDGTVGAASPGSCEDVGTAGRYERLVEGAHRGCTADEDCTTVELDCSHLNCSAVHRDHEAAYAGRIDCQGYPGPVGNYDCNPRFGIEAPRCRDGCCLSERILSVPPDGAVEATAEPDGASPPPCRTLGESAPASSNGLEAYLSMYHCADQAPGDLLINVRVWNVSQNAVRFFRMPTHYPMLVFDVRRFNGETIPNGPPPVPPAGPEDDWWLVLDPDEDYLFDASLGGVVAIDLEPGDYEIRFAYENADGTDDTWVGTLETGWVRFTRRPGAP